ncbi:MAG: apolipoprotein N-acyltransferase [Victivallaceae bacterium]|nr:apolipoprotein N-acyltransferase [Victivallaceae bacterium]
MPKFDPGASSTQNEAWRVRRTTAVAAIILLILSGMLMSASVPPLNWSAAAWVALIPLFLIADTQSPVKAAVCGFCWGLGWAFTGFYWLREIDPVIPYLIAPVMAAFPAMGAALVPVFSRNLLIPNDIQLQGYAAVRNFRQQSIWKNLLSCLLLAAWWCIVEWFRSRLLPWNYVSVSQWRNLPLIQLCAVTGTYGVSFLIVLVNATLAAAFRDGFRKTGKRLNHAAAFPFFISLFLVLAVSSFGVFKYRQLRKPRSVVEFNAALIQGDISQRRQATVEQALEAMNIYLELSSLAAKSHPVPDIIIWPETATPFAYNGNDRLAGSLRRKLGKLIAGTGRPMLIGSIDFERLPPRSTRRPGITNSALLLDPASEITGRYDKIQRVPFGEYVPFRKHLPEWAVKRIDMHRDLVPGGSYSPLPLLPGVRAGISICYEDIFEYIARRETLENANLLLTITNDAWYPASSEPDQHLANCVFRTIETGLPMLRCGNNSASCLIEADGFISDCLFRKESPHGGSAAAPEIRGRRAGIIKVRVPYKPELTFYTRYGNVFIALCWLPVIAGLAVSAGKWRRRKEILAGKFKTRTDTKA